VIALEAGATFAGPFVLPDKPGAEWIVVRTATPDSALPPPGTRIDHSFATVLPKLVAASGPVVATASGSHHYRFIGIEIRPRDGTFLSNLVLLGKGERALAQLPHNIIFDRCYIHGDPIKGARRGVAMNARDAAVIDSYLSDFKEVGADSQALAAWNSPGPFKIVNNYLEGAAENLLIGGGAPAIPGLVPSDVEIRRNHLAKPLSWKVGDPAYAGTQWTVKYILELKNALRVLIDGNVLERNWEATYAGFAVGFTVRNEDGSAPWSAVQDVTFINNVVHHAASGMNIGGRDKTFPSGSQQTKRILIKNNLFLDVGGPTWRGDGRLFQIVNGTADLVIDHNTAFQSGSPVIADGEAHTGFVYRNNITPHNAYGITGSGTNAGNLTFRTYFPGIVFARNVLAGPWAAGTPKSMYSEQPSNFFPASLDAVGFVNLTKGDYRLAPSSPYKRAGTDGKDLGVDFGALFAATVPPAAGSTLSRILNPPDSGSRETTR
jgi:hypothetical protein